MKSIFAIHPAITENTENILVKRAPHMHPADMFTTWNHYNETGHHKHEDIWAPFVGEFLHFGQENCNPKRMLCCMLTKVLDEYNIVGHELQEVVRYFIKHSNVNQPYLILSSLLPVNPFTRF